MNINPGISTTKIGGMTMHPKIILDVKLRIVILNQFDLLSEMYETIQINFNGNYSKQNVLRQKNETT